MSFEVMKTRDPSSSFAVAPRSNATPIKIGISACLLGEKVRYDGGHKRDEIVAGLLSRYVTVVPVCPEVELGLGVPREPIQLVERDGEIRLMSVETGRDFTAGMRRYAEKRVEELKKLDLSGYILKARSPSCGMERVPVHPEAGGRPAKKGRGLFAAALLERWPGLPVEEEGQLKNLFFRENFLERVFAYRRLRDFFRGGWKRGDLIRHHGAEKLLLMAHHPAGCQALGKLAAGAKDQPRGVLAEKYQRLFMAALERPATKGKHAGVLDRLAGSFAERLDAGEKKEFQETIQDFRRGRVPLIVPITLIRRHARRFQAADLAEQTYLAWHPMELRLRNQV